MPPRRSLGVSSPGRTGIMGTDTRQRFRLDWTPLSLQHLDGSPARLSAVSAPPPSPKHTGHTPPRAHACSSLEWDGTRERTCF